MTTRYVNSVTDSLQALLARTDRLPEGARALVREIMGLVVRLAEGQGVNYIAGPNPAGSSHYLLFLPKKPVR